MNRPLTDLLNALLREYPPERRFPLPASEAEQKRLARGLMNVRPPRPLSPDMERAQDEYLRAEQKKRGVTDIRALTPVRPGIYLWQGDITALKCDAIVNAANSGLTGCYCPNHKCIDNAIHTFSGMQLRQYCAALMEAQGHEEPTGTAKLTPAFNLPCRYVLHTVGPIVSGPLTAEDERLLASCYRSCLLLAEQNGLASVAFCCISTGEFHFPNERAAQIAVDAVEDFLTSSPHPMEVIFNVYKDIDYIIYDRLLRAH